MESYLPNATREEGASPLEPLSFVLGRDRGGHWIVQEAHGLCGGLFASKDAAIRYAGQKAHLPEHFKISEYPRSGGAARQTASYIDKERAPMDDEEL